MNKLNFFLIFLTITIGVSSQSNNCLDFDGNDDYIFIGDVNDLGSKDFTIEAWVYPESTAGIGQFVISKGITTVGIPSRAGYGLRINDNNNNDVEFIIGNSDSSVTIISSVSLTVGNWHHIAGVRSGIYMSLYVDGNIVAYDSTSTIFDVNTDIPLSIGAIDKGELSSVAEFVNGKIDEVRIWTVARTIDEIINNMDCAITSQEDNLMAVYNLNEGQGSSAADSSGFNNDGFFVSDPVWTDLSVAPICSTVGMEDVVPSENIELFPNPFINSITIKNGPLQGDFVVYNIQGQLIDSGTFSNSNISLPKIENGTYILEILSGNQVWRKRVIKINSY